MMVRVIFLHFVKFSTYNHLGMSCLVGMKRKIIQSHVWFLNWVRNGEKEWDMEHIMPILLYFSTKFEIQRPNENHRLSMLNAGNLHLFAEICRWEWWKRW